jgi:hypothetical protein
MGAAILSTGYIYASSEESVEQTLSNNDAVGMTVALLYQASYILPFGFVLNDLLSHAIKSCQRAEQRADPLAESLLLNTDPQQEKQGCKLISLACLQTAGLNLLAYGTGVGLLYISASAAYQLFGHDEAPSVIARAYRPIYGKSLYASVLAHLPQLPLAGGAAKNGVIAMGRCLSDIYQDPLHEKYAVACLALAILALTATATYLIASYGQVELIPLILALTAAVLGNYESAVKCSHGFAKLCRGQPKAALDCLTNSEPVTSFLRVAQNDPSIGASSAGVALELGEAV